MSVAVFGDGNGAEYTIQDTVFKPASYNPDDPDYRIELSPKNPAKTDLMLTVMYVTDAHNNDGCIKAQDISTEELCGAFIFGKAILFAKGNEAIASDFTISLPGGDCDTECYVAGLAGGKWQLTAGTDDLGVYDVKSDEGVLTFTTCGENITIRPI